MSTFMPQFVTVSDYDGETLYFKVENIMSLRMLQNDKSRCYIKVRHLDRDWTRVRFEDFKALAVLWAKYLRSIE